MPRRAHPSLFDDSGLPEGFVYREDIVTEAEEAELLPHIRQLEFGAVVMHGVTARRRVVQFGYRYGFDERRLEPTTAIPDYLLPLRERAAALAGILVESFSEALVTEYPPGATIGWHRDAPAFGVVAGVSLAAACRFRFRRGEPGAWETTEIVAAPRSAYVLAGPARTVWQHSIPAVPQLRYSVTFRTVRRRRGEPAAERTAEPRL